MRYVNAAPGEQPRDGLLPLVEGDDDFAVGRVVGCGHAVGDRRAGGRAGVAGTAAAAAVPGNVQAAIVRGRAAAAAAVVAAPAGPAARAGQAGGDIVSADAERAGRTRPALGNCAGRAGVGAGDRAARAGAAAGGSGAGPAAAAPAARGPGDRDRLAVSTGRIGVPAGPAGAERGHAHVAIAAARAATGHHQPVGQRVTTGRAADIAGTAPAAAIAIAGRAAATKRGAAVAGAGLADVDLQHGPGGDRQRAGDQCAEPACATGNWDAAHGTAHGGAALGTVQGESCRVDPGRNGPGLGAAGESERAGGHLAGRYAAA